MKTAVDGRTPVDATPPQDVALVDGDFVYAEYTRGTCTADVPPFIRSRFACGGTPASDAPDASVEKGKPDEPMPAAVDAAERERVLDLFRTQD
jgi:penicillin-binding protein 1A